MRIVYVLTSLGMGGAEKQALAVAERMEKRGHTVALLVLRPRLAEEWPTTLDTIHMEMRKTPASLFTGLSRARRFLRAFRPDLLHGHSFHANLFARCLGLPFLRRRVISTIHNVFEGGWPRVLAYRLTDPLSQLTVAVSEAVAQRFIHIRAVPAKKCLVITNGIDIAEFAPDPARRMRIRAELDPASERRDFIWLAAGRVVPAKDYPNLLRAFRQVREALPDVELWIGGAASHSVIEIVVEHGYQEKVRWLGMRREMPTLLDAADAFVSASAWEGMPLAVGEAMAMAKPVVATDVGGVCELVGEAGIAVPPRDSAALAKAMIATVQRSAEERAESGRRARDRIKQQFSIETRADAWEALYRKLLA